MVVTIVFKKQEVTSSFGFEACCRQFGVEGMGFPIRPSLCVLSCMVALDLSLLSGWWLWYVPSSYLGVHSQ